MISAQRCFGWDCFLTPALCWLFTVAVLLQVASAPELALRDAAAIADPLRASQLLCDQSSAGAPLNHHHKVPAPDGLQCLLNHGGFGAAFVSGAACALALSEGSANFLVAAPAAPTLAAVAAAYSARAPPV
jgi:hypothetical protein